MDHAKAAEAAPTPYWRVRSLLAEDRQSGEVKAIEVEISEPYEVEEGIVAVALRLEGLDRREHAEHGRALFGVDGFQALTHALFIAEAELDLAARTHEIRHVDGSPYQRMFPTSLG